MHQAARTRKPLALHALLESLVDYAGLFPPAALDMQTAAASYAQYREGEFSWMLGKFIVPAVRLQELASYLPDSSSLWSLSVLVGPDYEHDSIAIHEFLRSNGERATVDAIEGKVSTEDDLVRMARVIPPGVAGYAEVPLSGDDDRLLALVWDTQMRAKVRTGGLTNDAFPSAVALARFLRACASMRLPFKATAGLHHPIRCVRPLTYEKDSPTGLMHGFVNLFLAAAFVRLGMGESEVVQILEAEDASEFAFDDETARWRMHPISTEDLRSTRREFAISFGSCSFEDPICDLKSLNLI